MSDKELETRERILKAAKALFGAQGFAGTSIREIADASAANLSLISYYFGGKEGLFKTCVESFGMARLHSAQRLLVPAKSHDEIQLRLQMFIDEFLHGYLEEPALSRMIMREAEKRSELIKDVFARSFRKVFETLQHFLGDAQKKGFIHGKIDPQILTLMIFGALAHRCRMDDLVSAADPKQSLKNENYRNHMRDQILLILESGYSAKR